MVQRAIAARQMPGAVVVVGPRRHRGRTRRRSASGRWPPGRADDARHHLRHGVADQGRGHHLGGDAVSWSRAPCASPTRWRRGCPASSATARATSPCGTCSRTCRACGPTSTSGEPWKGYDAAIDLANDEVLQSAPGERFVYSDINFFLLGHIVARASGEPLERYVARHVLEPLGMTDSGFLPPIERIGRIAPTERCRYLDAWPCKAPDVEPLRGVVHDPTARRMGGVAGHAGLFSTARDLTRFVRMLLGGGVLGARRVLAPLTVAKMITPATPAGMRASRGLGWDVDTSFSVNRGELLPIGSFGHTGFTGTSIWVDPRTKLFVIFLSSRLHPDGTGDVSARARARRHDCRVCARRRAAARRSDQLRGSPAPTSAPSADPGPSSCLPCPRPRVLTGIDVVARDGFAVLKGRRGGSRHQPHRPRPERRNHDRPAAQGARRVAGGAVQPGARHSRRARRRACRRRATSRPAWRFIRSTAKRGAPRRRCSRGIDTLVVDLQDIGVRFYTYPATVGYVLEEAAKRKIRVVVLDRPNPINGWQIEGPLPDQEVIGFNAYLPMPIRHGMTLGELAQLFNAERRIGADLTVVRAEGWRRDQWFDHTGLTWVNPSPNMRNLNQAALYPGIGAIEYANISVGRGTDQPFEQIGAPWIDGPRLAAALNARGLPGIRFYPVQFTPASSVHAKQLCQGVFFVVTNREQLQPVRVGLEIASALWTLHGDQFDPRNTVRLVGSAAVLARAKAGEDPAAIAASWAGAEASWRRLRAKYLLYP